ncbi:MAG: DUF4259 domain-containing protein [Pirellulales bacterium]
MGIWAHGAFENDDALDWIGELETARDGAVLAKAFDAVSQARQGEIDVSSAATALAAAEVVAALAGRPQMDLPEEVTAWVAGQQPPRLELLAQAQHVAQRVMHDSELRDRWAESGDETGWQLEVAGLLRRLHEAAVEGFE